MPKGRTSNKKFYAGKSKRKSSGGKLKPLRNSYSKKGSRP